MSARFNLMVFLPYIAVIMALATPDYVVIIPQFLDSMVSSLSCFVLLIDSTILCVVLNIQRGIEASIVVPDRVLVSALAAAVAVGSDPVATEVARLIENTHSKLSSAECVV